MFGLNRVVCGKKLGSLLGTGFIIVMLPAMLLQGVGEFLIYGMGYWPRRLFNRKAQLTDDINAWLGILYWFLLVAAAFAYYSGVHS